MLRRYVPSPRRQAAVLAGICGLVLLWRYVLILGLHASFDRTYVGTDTRIDSILFGCILGVLGNPAISQVSEARKSRISRWWAPALVPFALLTLVLVYPWPGNLGPAIFRNPDFSATSEYTLEGLALIPIFVAAVTYSRWGIFRILNHRAVVLVGLLSYTMYISEEIIIALAKDLPGGQVVHGPIYLAFTLLFAYAMYRIVEKPFARVRKRLSAPAMKHPLPVAATYDSPPRTERQHLRAALDLPLVSPPDVVSSPEPSVQVE
jgi:peptidoglycan/LPS O-acetylase OafA/YrhL